jgi:Dyp-type peroxidase family
MAIDLTQVGIDLEDPAVKPLLSDLQGNIFKGHGRQHSAYLFVTFRSDQSQAIRRWIRRFARVHVTTAEDQIKDARRFHELGLDAGLFINFFLSAKGYEVLGFREDQIPRDKGDKYANGMKKAALALKDPPLKEWDEGYQEEIHALVFLADTDLTALDRALTRFTDQLQPLSGKLKVEYGQRWRGPDGKQDIEPFGFADGISQPLFLTDEIEHAQQVGIDRWDPSAPLNLVLVKDPNGVGEDSYGSFFVFRKLEQDVAGFHQRLAEVTQALGTDTGLAGAYVVGRFQDGTPVELHDHEVGAETQDYVTNFNYADDMEAGSRCPFHAHIRKTNPRGDTVRAFEGDYKFERNHRIVRRGVPFGKQPPRGTIPTWPVGLLFTCYQSDIGNQFELLQTSWANSIQFVRQQTGLDPIIGQGEQLIGGQGWPSKYGDDSAAKVRFDFSPYVKLKGGEYFFAPSLGFLTSL